MALVDFVEPSEARAAFKGLAYRRYKHVPLYLEWAPLGVVSGDKKETGKQSVSGSIESLKGGASGDHDTLKKDITKDLNKDKRAAIDKSHEKASADAEALKVNPETEDIPLEYASLFVKNLNFKSNEAALRQHANRLGCGDSQGLRAVSFPKKISAGVPLSMGFGFLEYSSTASAQHACRCLHGSVLDGHALDVQPSDKRITVATQRTPIATDSDDSCKLLVRNVAFQATKKELRALFSAFGAVKSVRIPKKMGGKHRGFAFIELSSVQEATAAKNALSNTHLYGRHLVIENAADDDLSLDVLRKRAGADQVAINHDKKRAKLSSILDYNQEGILAFGKN